jgi:hypothetical protein
MIKRMRKYYGVCIAAVLLLGFSVTFLPLDLLHNHKTERSAQTCLDKDAKGTCSHKLHLSEKAAYCSVCAIHVDKVFVTAEQQKATSIFPVLTEFAESKIIQAVSDIIFYSLRGPPSND